MDTIEEESAKDSANIVSGDNILFSQMKVGERNMVLGSVGLISEIAKFLYSPEECLMEFDSMIEKHAVKNSLLTVGALKASFLLNRNNGFKNTSEIIQWITLEVLETSSSICKKIEEKWPHPKAEDRAKEDFDEKKWPQPNPKEVVLFVYECDEWKTLYNKMRDALHGYTNSIYTELDKELETTIWMLDIFKGLKEEDLRNQIELVKLVEHQYIDWMFNEKIRDAAIEVVKSSFGLIDLLQIGAFKLKKFLSFDKKLDDVEDFEDEE